jgi:hypothetical protein
MKIINKLKQLFKKENQDSDDSSDSNKLKLYQLRNYIYHSGCIGLERIDIPISNIIITTNFRTEETPNDNWDLHVIGIESMYRPMLTSVLLSNIHDISIEDAEAGTCISFKAAMDNSIYSGYKFKLYCFELNSILKK